MKLEDFEKEYYEEINKTEVKVEDLEKLGVNKKTLSKEVYLKNLYGDEIVDDGSGDIQNVKGAKKIVAKLTEEELGLKSEFVNIFSAIDRSMFDKNFDELGLRLDEEEDR